LHRGLVSKPAEHDVRQLIELGMRGAQDVWVTITQHGAPPGGHAIDQPSPIGELQMNALGARYEIARLSARQRGIRMPDVLAVKAQPLVQQCRVYVRSHFGAEISKFYGRA
jgi:hypothetical protein